MIDTNDDQSESSITGIDPELAADITHQAALAALELIIDRRVAFLVRGAVESVRVRVEYEIRNGEVVYVDHGPVGVLVTEQHVGQTTEPTLSDLSAGLITVYGTDYGIHSPTSISRFTDAARQAASYRKGRALIAGDAAHVHPPDGSQGPQTGVQDAVTT
jgi:hypothetical protein